jgi:hypothetical protein
MDQATGNWRDPAAAARRDFYYAFDQTGIKLTPEGERKLAEAFQKTVAYAIYKRDASWEQNRSFVLKVLGEMCELLKKEGETAPPSETKVELAADTVIAKWKKICGAKAAEMGLANWGPFCDIFELSNSESTPEGQRSGSSG